MSEHILLIDMNAPAWSEMVDVFQVEPLRAEPTTSGVRYSYSLGYRVNPHVAASLARRCAVICVDDDALARGGRGEGA